MVDSASPQDWRQYEATIHDHFRAVFPSATITLGTTLSGRYSKIDRQVDVLIEGDVAGFPFRIAVDAKFRNHTLDVTDVEAFLGYCDDLGATKGVLVALNGFSPAALRRAYNDPSNIELDVLTFDELRELQGLAGITYSGRHGVFLTAPFGWVIDPLRVVDLGLLQTHT